MDKVIKCVESGCCIWFYWNNNLIECIVCVVIGSE